ncbi:MAG: hypothetical protein SPL44_00725, partial [Bacteroidales bacterium]|nr:hypothetical protein [Bacteroidales bacterium]
QTKQLLLIRLRWLMSLQLKEKRRIPRTARAVASTTVPMTGRAAASTTAVTTVHLGVGAVLMSVRQDLAAIPMKI